MKTIAGDKREKRGDNKQYAIIKTIDSWRQEREKLETRERKGGIINNMLLWRQEREKTMKTIAGDKREKRGGGDNKHYAIIKTIAGEKREKRGDNKQYAIIKTIWRQEREKGG